ncbi:MAG: hypothetical protein JNM57_02615 [Cyclobacteriaceae bacterium]|nr:hypothetical protein [Cyclobacteriaceae bacterium]
MKKVTVCLLFLLPVFFVNGQIAGRIAGERLLLRTSSAAYEHGNGDVQGSPYLYDDFKEGQVISFKGHYKGIPMRYNIYDDNIEFKQNGVDMILDPDISIKKVILSDMILTVGKFEYRNKVQFGFLERLDSGQLSLFAKKVVVFKEKEETQALEYNTKPARFTSLSDIFYYRIGNGDISKIVSIKKLIESLPDKQTEMSAYAKKEKLSVGRNDLLKFAEHYGSLH